ncbi:MAG: TetR/AcrR family transcriptional regulator [Roseibium sp.]
MTDAPTKARKRDGSLPSALVDAGIELLRERGSGGLSLRECAAKANVSHAAPGYHFKNLKGLSTAIATRGFGHFVDAMEKRRKSATTNPKAQLKAICQGYLDFASDYPELFLFIFSGQQFNKDDEPFETVASKAYAILREACAPYVPTESRPEEIEILVWSLVHGFAHLSMTRKLDNPQLGRTWPDFDVVIGHLFKSITAAQE